METFNKRKLSVLFIIIIVTEYSSAIEILTFTSCEKDGWRCDKMGESKRIYRLQYDCKSQLEEWIFYLWNFNAPAYLEEMKIVNCSNIWLNLQCQPQERRIDKLHLKNIKLLNITNLPYKDTFRLPTFVTFENIDQIPSIPEMTFRHMENAPLAIYKCSEHAFPVQSITFKNVNIDKIQRNAFYNLTNVKKFSWNNVNVFRMKSFAVHAKMDLDSEFVVTNSAFRKLGNKAFDIRTPNFKIDNNFFDDLPLNAFIVACQQFDFINNRVNTIHAYAFNILGQDVNFQNNTIKWLQTNALQGIEPGLILKDFVSFHTIQFHYNFSNNTIMHADVASLNPDWVAYENVKSDVKVTDNFLPCACKELGWITLRNGLGQEYSRMLTFNGKFLNNENNNLCLDAPCNLPVSVMTAKSIKFGVCTTNDSLEYWCQKYDANNTNGYGLGELASIILDKWNYDLIKENNKHDDTIIDYNLEDILIVSQKPKPQPENSKPSIAPDKNSNNSGNDSKNPPKESSVNTEPPKETPVSTEPSISPDTNLNNSKIPPTETPVNTEPSITPDTNLNTSIDNTEIPPEETSVNTEPSIAPDRNLNNSVNSSEIPPKETTVNTESSIFPDTDLTTTVNDTEILATESSTNVENYTTLDKNSHKSRTYFEALSDVPLTTTEYFVIFNKNSDSSVDNSEKYSEESLSNTDRSVVLNKNMNRHMNDPEESLFNTDRSIILHKNLSFVNYSKKVPEESYFNAERSVFSDKNRSNLTSIEDKLMLLGTDETTLFTNKNNEHTSFVFSIANKTASNITKFEIEIDPEQQKMKK